jgi:hypothetical protein
MKLATSFLVIGSAMAFAPNSNNNHQNVAQRTNSVKLSLWGEAPKKDGEGSEMSTALPFVPRPKILDGTLAGDAGFE